MHVGVGDAVNVADEDEDAEELDEDDCPVDELIVFVEMLEDWEDVELAADLSDEVIEDEVIEDEVIEDEVIEDGVIEDEVIEDGVIEDEVIEDEVIEDEVIGDVVAEDEVTEDVTAEDEVDEGVVAEDEVTENVVIEDELVDVEVVRDEVAGDADEVEVDVVESEGVMEMLVIVVLLEVDTLVDCEVEEVGIEVLETRETDDWLLEVDTPARPCQTASCTPDEPAMLSGAILNTWLIFVGRSIFSVRICYQPNFAQHHEHSGDIGLDTEYKYQRFVICGIVIYRHFVKFAHCNTHKYSAMHVSRRLVSFTSVHRKHLYVHEHHGSLNSTSALYLFLKHIDSVGSPSPTSSAPISSSSAQLSSTSSSRSQHVCLRKPDIYIHLISAGDHQQYVHVNNITYLAKLDTYRDQYPDCILHQQYYGQRVEQQQYELHYERATDEQLEYSGVVFECIGE
ncbi:hypothetical protein B0A48_03906 [Cryoendolithus antarcticus]|uniref:Uncharacterized protein n=1 Tax=Cryoendolithus antarcticus TaxID=1507870 RepID=A0A1V8TH75_9PEZI|nr:hypothetical protein B0A48_03906 [Cryoendolithus antarcticus]